MIFFISANKEFENTFLVETKDLNIGSEGNSFQVDNAQLSGLNIKGNSFNIVANKIHPIDNKLPVISGNIISGNINIYPKVLIKIRSKIAELNTKNNTLKLDGNFEIENENFQINGTEILFNFKENSIVSDRSVTFLFPNGQIYGGKIEVINSKNKKNGLLFLINDGVKIKYLL